jgi:hypothetical protein
MPCSFSTVHTKISDTCFPLFSLALSKTVLKWTTSSWLVNILISMAKMVQLCVSCNAILHLGGSSEATSLSMDFGEMCIDNVFIGHTAACILPSAILKHARAMSSVKAWQFHDIRPPGKPQDRGTCLLCRHLYSSIPSDRHTSSVRRCTSHFLPPRTVLYPRLCIK